MSKIEVQAIVHGFVQGVGFRWTAQAIARRLGLVGSVRNLADSTVEIVVQGDKAKIDQFLDELRLCDHPARVDKVVATSTTPSETFHDFQILF
jgi:acylphosphatase